MNRDQRPTWIMTHLIHFPSINDHWLVSQVPFGDHFCYPSIRKSGSVIVNLTLSQCTLCLGLSFPVSRTTGQLCISIYHQPLQLTAYLVPLFSRNLLKSGNGFYLRQIILATYILFLSLGDPRPLPYLTQPSIPQRLPT